MATKNKSILSFLKLLPFLFFVSLSYNASAQKPIFVRVFNLSGKKIHKGNVYAVTDSSLQLAGRKEQIIILKNMIGYIITKRPAGNNIFIGSVMGGLAGGVIGGVTPSPGNSFLSFTQSEAIILGTLSGASLGAGIGALTTLLKHSKRYVIEGDKTKWKVFQTMISENNQ